MAKRETVADWILEQDDWLVALNKPAGLLSIADGYDPGKPSLASLLEEAFGRAWTVHRLDRETSGVLVFALTAEAHAALSIQFERRTAHKLYHAIVAGRPPWQERLVELPLRIDGDRQHRTVVDARFGKPAATRLRVLEAFSGYALLEAQPHTGYTHQIRAHLAAAGFPIAGDALYGEGRGVLLSAAKAGYKAGAGGEAPLLGRLALHAHRLTLAHPADGAMREYSAPYPKDFAVALKQLRKYGHS